MVQGYSYNGSFRLNCLSIFNVFMHFSNLLFSKESENNNHFFQKNYLKSYSVLNLFFSYSTLMKLKL